MAVTQLDNQRSKILGLLTHVDAMIMTSTRHQILYWMC